MEQTKAALRQVIGGLNDGDRFNVITYSTGVVPLWDEPKDATNATRKEATEFVEAIRPTGGTNIDGALKMALSQPGKPGMPRVLLFLTDGRPTMGETTDPDEIVKRATDAQQGRQGRGSSSSGSGSTSTRCCSTGWHSATTAPRPTCAPTRTSSARSRRSTTRSVTPC